MIAPLPAFAASVGVLKTLLGSKMNDVAQKIVTLAEPYRDIWIRGLDFSPDGTQVAANSADETLKIWNWREGKVVKTLEVPRGFNWGPAVNPIQYSPDGKFLSVCEGKGAGHVVIRVWNTKEWSIAKDIVDTGPGGCQSAVFTPDGRFLLYVIDRVRSDELIAYATDAWNLAWRVQLDTSPEAIAISPDGHFAAVSGMTTIVQRAGAASSPVDLQYEQTVDLVDVSARTLVKTLHGDARGPIAWTPDSARIAVAGQLWVEMFDAHSGKRMVHARVAESSNMNLRFTADGRYLVESDTNGRNTGLGVSIWNSDRTKLLQKIPGDAGSIAISKDGKYLAIGGTSHTTICQLQ